MTTKKSFKGKERITVAPRLKETDGEKCLKHELELNDAKKDIKSFVDFKDDLKVAIKALTDHVQNLTNKIEAVHVAQQMAGKDQMISSLNIQSAIQSFEGRMILMEQSIRTKASEESVATAKTESAARIKTISDRLEDHEEDPRHVNGNISAILSGVMIFVVLCGGVLSFFKTIM